MRTGDLVRRARDVSRVVVAVAWLVMAVRKDSQVAFRVRCHQLGFRARIVEGLTASIDLEFFLDGATYAFGT